MEYINHFAPKLNACCDLQKTAADWNVKDCIYATIIHHW